LCKYTLIKRAYMDCQVLRFCWTDAFGMSHVGTHLQPAATWKMAS